MKTNEGAYAFEHTLDHALEFFSKAGSAFVKSKPFYGNTFKGTPPESALSLFQKSFIVNKELSMKLLFWLRDPRGGAGNRSGARECLKWVAQTEPDWILLNLDRIPEYGRWDDIRSLFETDVGQLAANYWASKIRANDVLAAKWADRNDRLVRQALGLKIGPFRRLLASIRQNHIVEKKMCTDEWTKIKYETVPSVAMSRYTNAFKRHDADGFLKFKEDVKSGVKKVHAEVLFPHDCVRASKNGDTEMADAQFDALPNFMDGTNEKIIVICDTSGSMDAPVAGEIRAVDISQGLALYCSSRFEEDSPFYKRFIAFCSESTFKEWRGMTFSRAIRNRRVFNGAVGSTRIDTALDLILSIAKERNIPQDMMPTCLLIVSDMQFHDGGSATGETEIERSLKKWDTEGYSRPKIVFWNTSSYQGTQATALDKNVALISGFSPSILKSVISGEDFSPRGIMLKAVEKYEVKSPYHIQDKDLEI